MFRNNSLADTIPTIRDFQANLSNVNIALVLAAVQKNPFIWESLKNARFREQLIAYASDDIANWSSASISDFALAHWICGLDTVPSPAGLAEKLQSDPSLEAFTREVEEAMSSQNPQKSLLDTPLDGLSEDANRGLITAALLARVLLTRDLIEGSTLPKVNSSGDGDLEIWTTTISILVGKVPDPYLFLESILQNDAFPDSISVGVQAIFRNPAPAAETTLLLADLITPLDLNFSKHALVEISKNDPSIAKEISKKLLAGETGERIDEIPDGHGAIVSQDVLDMYLLAGDHLEAMAATQNAIRETGALETELIKRYFWAARENSFTDQEWDSLGEGLGIIQNSPFFRQNQNTFKAARMLELGQVERAADLIGDESNDTDTLIVQAEVANKSGGPIDLIQELTRRAYLGATHANVDVPAIGKARFTRIATLFQACNLPAEAARAANAALALDTSDPETYLLLNQAYRKAGQLELAEVAIRLGSLASDGSSPTLQANFIETLEESEQWEEALSQRVAYLEGIDLPQLEDLQNLAACALQAKENKLAIDIATEALLLEPEDSLTNTILGDALFRSGSKEEGISRLQSAVQLNPQVPEPWITLAGSQLALGDLPSAVDTLRSATHAAPQSSDIFLALGKLYLEDHSPTQATTYFEKAVELSPESSTANAMLGNALFEIGRTSEAEEYLSKAFDVSPYDLEVAHSFARVKLATNKPAEALKSLALILQSNPESPDPYFDYGCALLDIGDAPEEAIEAFEKVLERDHHYEEARGRLADAYLSAKRWEDALEIYAELLETTPVEKTTWKGHLLSGAGRASFLLGDTEKSIILYREAIELEPEDARLYQYLSEAYSKGSLREDSLEAAREALARGADDLDTLKWFANMAILQESQSEALSALRRAVELAPLQIDLQILLGQTQLRAGEESDAWDTFSSLLTSDVVSAADLENVANGFVELGDHRSAIDCLSIAVEKSSRPAELYMVLSGVQERVGDFEAALESLEKVGEITEESAALSMRKSRILQLLDRPQAALGCMQQAINLEPDNPDLYGWGAEVLRVSGDLRAAITYAEKRLRLDPQSLSARYQTADLARGVLETEYALRVLKNGWPRASNLETSDTEEKAFPGDGIEYFCLYGDLCLAEEDEISAAEALTAASRIDPDHLRVVALQARFRGRQGSLVEANALYNSIASNFEQLSQSPNRDASLEISLAEAAIELSLWDSASDLLERSIDARPSEALPHFLQAKFLVLRAEAQAYAELFGLSMHAPGSEAISTEAHSEFDKMVRTTNSLLEATDNRDEISEWVARAKAIFVQDLKSIKFLESTASNYEEALPVVTAAVRANQLDISKRVARANLHTPEIRGLLALSLFRQGSLEEALLETEEARRSAQDDPILNYIMSKILWASGQEIPAIESLEAGLELWPDEPGWHAQAATLIVKSAKPSDESVLGTAISHLETALALVPGNVDYLIALGQTLLNVGRVDEATFKFQEACQLNPQEKEPWVLLATAQLAEELYESAEKSVLIAIELEPDFIDAQVLYARIAWEESNPTVALERIEAALAANPKDAEALYLKARCLDMLGRPTEALKLIDQAVNFTADPLPYMIDRVRILKRAKGKDEAIEAIEMLSQVYPDEPSIYALMARSLVESGQEAKAITAAQKALKKGGGTFNAGETAYLNEMVGRLQRRSGQLDQSIFHLTEAVKQNPNSPDAHFELSQAYLDRRDYSDALEVLGQAISEHPDQARLYYQAGVAHKECKEYQKAESMLRKAAELSPSDLSIHRQLGAVVALNIVNNSREAALSV